jgi:hypothetical protein
MSSRGRGSRSNPGLRVRGKIFSILAHEELVVKLSADGVAELVDGGTGSRFDAGKGRSMRKWASVPVEHRRR